MWCEKSDTSQGCVKALWKNWSPTPLPARKGAEGTEAAASTTFTTNNRRNQPTELEEFSHLSKFTSVIPVTVTGQFLGLDGMPSFIQPKRKR